VLLRDPASPVPRWLLPSAAAGVTGRSVTGRPRSLPAAAHDGGTDSPADDGCARPGGAPWGSAGSLLGELAGYLVGDLVRDPVGLRPFRGCREIRRRA